jgi:hypothetical protein
MTLPKFSATEYIPNPTPTTACGTTHGTMERMMVGRRLCTTARVSTPTNGDHARKPGG